MARSSDEDLDTTTTTTDDDEDTSRPPSRGSSSSSDGVAVHGPSDHGDVPPAAPHQCMGCGKTFSSEGHKNRHVRHRCIGNSVGIRCPHCNRLFPAKKYLNRHIRRRHAELLASPCIFCDFVSSNGRQELVAHVRAQHDPSEQEEDGFQLANSALQGSVLVFAYFFFHESLDEALSPAMVERIEARLKFYLFIFGKSVVVVVRVTQLAAVWAASHTAAHTGITHTHTHGGMLFRCPPLLPELCCHAGAGLHRPWRGC